MENQGLEGATQLEDALASAGFLPRDVRWVINTHLHFDHAGGNTTLDPELEDDRRRHVRPTFPNATYVVQQGELEFARQANERTRASYLPAQLRADRRGAAAGGCSRATGKCCRGSRCG